MASAAEDGRADSAPLDPRLGPDGHGPYRLLRAGRARLIDRYLHALDHPEEAQRQRLAAVLSATRDSAFGRAHDLARVRTLADLRDAVPVRTHDELRPWLDRVAAGETGVLTVDPVRQLLETSGTTGQPKHLPVTDAWARSVAEAQSLWMLAMVRDHEQAARGRALTVVSPAAHSRSPGGLPIGSNTGRMHRAQPWYVRARYPVPYSVFCMAPAPLRQYALLRFALQAQVSSLTTANPSTVLLLARRLLEWRDELSADLADGTLRRGPAAALSPRDQWLFGLRLRRQPVPTDWRPASLWPLAVVNCWKGGPAAYFCERLPDALGADIPVREVGITASEGYFAVPLGQDWGGGALWTLGHVLEFVAEDGTMRWAWELEPGERVRLVISTEAGLLRYDLQDTLEVVGRVGRTPVVRFVGKSGRFLNAIGEKVTEAQVSEAMRQVARTLGVHPVGFTARVVWAEVPHIELAVEGAESAALPAVAEKFDRAMRELNVEYDDRRGTDRLGAAQALAVPGGCYAAWRARRVEAGAPEGQVKDPLIAINDDEWAQVVGARRGGPA